MSSKKLQFVKTRAKKNKEIINELVGMADLSFEVVADASANYVDIQTMSPEESVLQSLQNLMRLPVGGNVLFPARGEQISKMLFNPALSESESKTQLISYLNANEPRIHINNIKASKYVDDYNEQIVTFNISYSFKNSSEIHDAIINLKASGI